MTNFALIKFYLIEHKLKKVGFNLDFIKTHFNKYKANFNKQ